MVTLAVLVTIAALAFGGFRRNELEGQRHRFVDNVRGALTQARNRAIDDQTLVRVAVTSTTLTLTSWDPVTETWNLFERVTMERNEDALLQLNDQVCIFGLGDGVQAPSTAEAVAPPVSCLADEQLLQFEPDGTFTDPDNAFNTIPNAGVTLWIGDTTVPGEITYSVVQLFPGGLIRVFEELS